ncbi:MAG: LysM peptidoglycan-binding domain-containing protein [Chitinophagaceae bacterium]|nr:LysM peptidoglycan-binding domain-containing protein [Chitinophagaceae bacterium]
MSKSHTVQENETLSSIAQQYNLKSYLPIVEANKKNWPTLGKDPNVITPGIKLEIPDIAEKTIQRQSGTQNPVYMPSKKGDDTYLWLTIEDPYSFIEMDKIALKVEGRDRPSIIFDYVDSTADASRIVTIVSKEKLEPGDSAGEVKLPFNKFGKKSEEVIFLEIGGLDPIVTVGKNEVIENHKAIQKLLTNIGYYDEDIDGNLESKKSIEAITRFQIEHNVRSKKIGECDTATLIHLLLQNRISSDLSERKDAKSETNRSIYRTPLFKSNAVSASIGVSNINMDIKDYFEPQGFIPTIGNPKRREIKDLDTEYPKRAFVAPTNVPFQEVFQRSPEGRVKTESQNGSTIYIHKSGVKSKTYPDHPNIIKSKLQRYAFLDCGVWKETHAEFGVIWGRHVYLCEYTTGMSKFTDDATNRQEGLDFEFFKAFMKRKGKQSQYNTVIKNAAYCSWGHDGEYDFDNLHVIIPDLHLLAPSAARVWQGGDYTLEAEVKLLDFALGLIDVNRSALNKKLKVIQLGDSYDLWIDFGFISREDKPALQREINDIFTMSDFIERVRTEVNKSDEDYWESKYIELLQILAKYSNKPLYEKNEILQMHIATNISGLVCIDKKKLRSKFEEWRRNMFLEKGSYHYSPFDISKSFYNPAASPKELIKEQIYRIEGLMEDDFQNNKLYFENDLYKKNIDTCVALIHNTELKQYLTAINHLGVSRFINPATTALQYLEDKLGDNIVYLYGNHDNYLADKKLTDTIKFKEKPMKERKLLYQSKSLFVEHGHRNEFEFQKESPALYAKGKKDLISNLVSTGELKLSLASWKKGGVPTNYDGSVSGFEATCENLKDKFANWAKRKFAEFIANQADDVAQNHDQPSYKKTFSRLKIGRVSNNYKVPNIFVIGHTHKSALEIVSIKGYEQEEKEAMETMEDFKARGRKKEMGGW